MNSDGRSYSYSSLESMRFRTEIQDPPTFISKRLEVAINTGLLDDAKKLALVLAKTKIPIGVRDLTGIESEIRVTVIIVQRTLYNGDEIRQNLNALPSSSIYSLKTQVWQLYKFLPEEQRLIISNRLALNHELLSKFLTDSERNFTVHVYIMSKENLQTRKVHLDQRLK